MNRADTVTKNNNKRDCAMDLMRILMMLFIVNFHFMAAAGREDSYVYGYANGGWGSVGTGMFFMLSGYFLWQNHKDKNFTGTKLRKFYKSHLLSLYIPFYVTYIPAFVIMALRAGRIGFSGPLWTLVFSVLGIDNYVSFLGGQAYYFSVGEWYSTIIILLYLLCPLLIIIKRKINYAGLLVFFILYMLNIYISPLGISPDAGLPTGLFLFYLGMIISDKREIFLKKKILLPVEIIIILLVIFVKLPTINNNALLWKNMLAVSIFLAFYFFFHKILDGRGDLKPVSFLGKIMYCVYLSHHFILYRFFLNSLNLAQGRRDLLIVYIKYIPLTLFVSWILWIISAKIVKLLSK